MAVKKSKKQIFIESVKDKSNSHFLLVTVLFLGVSLYALFSFFFTNREYINSFHASVVDSSENVSVVEAEPVSIFTDVFYDHPYAFPIEVISNAGIMNGYDDGSFRPDNTINRAEFLVVLTNAVDADFSGKSYDNCFSDVSDEWYAVFVCYAKEQGWVSGFSDGKYKPQEASTKAGVVKIAVEAFGFDPCEVVEEPPFEDVPVDAWYAPYACLVRIENLLPGAKFDPDKNMTRAELAHLIYNMMSRKGLL
jgi:hypothetical protein